jgi:hypothetical protein
MHLPCRNRRDQEGSLGSRSSTESKSAQYKQARYQPRQRSVVPRRCASTRSSDSTCSHAPVQYRLSEARAEVHAGRSRGVSRPSRTRVAVCDRADDHRRTAGSLAGRHRQQRPGAVQVEDARRPLGCRGEATRPCNMYPAWRACSGSTCDTSASERVSGTSCQPGRSIACRTDTRRASTACSGCWPSTASECSSTSSERSSRGGENLYCRHFSGNVTLQAGTMCLPAQTRVTSPFSCRE